MYRQILVHEDDRRFQLILWRNHPSEELEAYQLNTVTYGTTSAPYLATKCLQGLASEGATKYPLGANVLSKNFYVDDVMAGSDSLSQTLEMRDQLNSLLKTAGLTLRKWCANDQNLLKNIPTEDLALQLDLDIDNVTQFKTLSQGWQPKSDMFTIHVQPTKTEKITKRTALSDISQLFDPLGFLGPVVITAKMFLQKLWACGYDWDTQLPNDLQTEWSKFRENLNYLQDVKIDRHIFGHRIPTSVQVHAFADASEKGYGAAIYIRAVNKDKIVTVRLL
ncbi:uncharacterized protein LOC129919166 [Episyrphus balteatus]|uniref:uncharacterized protein LOC129919166 n=1 Tax=Episyrphus balteatus TaxID=286459 RepID=UPI0024868320|nr:uncharacterized protein LOC129919166 [Episyrphus balteatus]